MGNLPLALTTEVSLYVLSVIHLWSLVQEISGQTFPKGNISKAFYKATFSEEFMSIFLATLNSVPCFLRQGTCSSQVGYAGNISFCFLSSGIISMF